MTATRIIELDAARVELRADGIVHLTFKEGVLIKKELHSELKATFALLGLNPVKKMMVSSQDFIYTEKTFWEQCKKSERFARGQMIAVIAPTLATRILAHNYLFRHKPSNPFRIFDNDSAAAQWLSNSKLSFLPDEGI